MDGERLTARLSDLLQNRVNLCDLRLHGERMDLREEVGQGQEGRRGVLPRNASQRRLRLVMWLSGEVCSSNSACCLSLRAA